MLTHSVQIYSILLIEDKNLLISSGLDGSKLWDLNNYKLIIHFKETCCDVGMVYVELMKIK